jgi:hypothetical protein
LPSKDLTTYKDAVWDYLLEHSEITQGGALFVKFHTKGRRAFEGHVEARAKGYHREDPRAKEQVKEARQQAFQAKKQAKKTRYLEQQAMRRAVKRVARVNWRRRVWRRVMGFLGLG